MFSYIGNFASLVSTEKELIPKETSEKAAGIIAKFLKGSLNTKDHEEFMGHYYEFTESIIPYLKPYYQLEDILDAKIVAQVNDFFDKHGRPENPSDEGEKK